MDKQTKSNMPLDESKLDFEIPRTDQPREKIIKLGKMITDHMGAKITGNDPEYWGFASLVTDEMADVALKMKVRKPKTLAQIAKLTGKDPAHLEKLLTEMAYIGIVEYNWENLDGKNPKHEKRWVLPQYIPGSAEFMNMRQSQIDEHPEVAAFFERMTFLPLEKVTPMVPPGGAGIGMHVVPVEKAIEMEQKSVSVEHISHWLDKYDGVYAASSCSCRMSRAKLGEGCGDDPEDWCIAVGDMAKYIVETGRGRYIDREEALSILKEGGGQRLCPSNQQYRRRGENHRHLQLQCEHLQRSAHLPAVQHPQPLPLRLCGGGENEELCGLRALRGGVPRRSGEAGAEAVRQGRHTHPVPPPRAA